MWFGRGCEKCPAVCFVRGFLYSFFFSGKKIDPSEKKTPDPTNDTFWGLKTVGSRFQPIRSVQEVVVEVDAGGSGKSGVRGPIWVDDWKKIPTITRVFFRG